MMTTTEQAAALTRVGDAMTTASNAIGLLRESREQNERLREAAIQARWLLKVLDAVPVALMPATLQVRADVSTAKILLASALEQVGQ